MTDLEVVGWDLETHPIGPGAIAPKPVCISIACDGIEAVYATCEKDFEEALDFIFSSTVRSVGHFIAYDLACILFHYPQYAERMFKCLDDGLVVDTMVREKLRYLADTGDLKYITLPDGTQKPIAFQLTDLELKYLDIDRSAEKDNTSDNWRTNFAALDGIPASQYPPEAYEYSKADAVNVRKIYFKQFEKAHPQAFSTDAFQTRASFALYLQTCYGMVTDPEMVEKKVKEFSALFDDSNYPEMLKLGVLRPSQPARPHARQAQKALQLLQEAGEETPYDWPKLRPLLEQFGIKFTEEKPSSIDEKRLHQVVYEVCASANLEVPLTEKGNVCFDAEVQADISSLHPVLSEYSERQEVRNLVTSFLPKLKEPVLYPSYDVLKETGRTGSRSDRKGKPGLYPALHVQGIDARVRECFTARPGWVLCSVDFDFIELVSLAQKCLTLFGHSVLAEKINAGVDPHAFLGAQLCYDFDAGFRDATLKAGLGGTQDDTYEAFMKLRDLNEALWSHYRTFAKPTGLGLPGGLGAERFLGYAKTTFGVDLVKHFGGLEPALEAARGLKQTWLKTYPEMPEYFGWVNRELLDIDWCGEQKAYCYVSPLGMLRRNCQYTEACNGAALQTPTAEGAKQAVWEIARACHDPSQGSCLYGCHPVAFIHDQIITEIPIDEWMHERAWEMARIMRTAMEKIMTKVKVGAKPVLMLHWSKKAKTVTGPDGRLQIWQPTPTGKQ